MSRRLRGEGEPLDVVIAGGGVAALEAALALCDLAPGRTRLTLVGPQDEFVLRPMLVGTPFAKGTPQRIPLERFAHDVGAELVRGTVTAVDAGMHELVLDGGRRRGYDVLVVAVGARPVLSYPRALTFTLERERDGFSGLLRDLEQGYCKRVAFVAPPGLTWTVPLYELALLTAGQLWGMGIEDTEIHVVTPEREPLELFGRAASDDVHRLLRRARIHLHTGVEAEQLSDGTLLLQPNGSTLERLRVVAVPKLVGPQIAGLPRDADGFIPVDEYGRVSGTDGVYAAGDATDNPVKQGGLAAQQADVVAAAIARDAGAEIAVGPYRPVLRGVLLTGTTEHHLRSTEHGVGIASEHLLWWPPNKVAGRYLAPYLAGELGETLMELPPHSHRIQIDVPLSRAASSAPKETT